MSEETRRQRTPDDMGQDRLATRIARQDERRGGGTIQDEDDTRAGTNSKTTRTPRKARSAPRADTTGREAARCQDETRDETGGRDGGRDDAERDEERDATRCSCQLILVFRKGIFS